MENAFLKSILYDSDEITLVLVHQRVLPRVENHVLVTQNEDILMELKPNGVQKWISNTRNGLGTLW